MDSKTAGAVGGAGVVGVVLGMFLSGPSGPDAEALQEMIRSEVSGVSGELESRMSELGGQMESGVSGMNDSVAALSERLSGLESELATSFESGLAALQEGQSGAASGSDLASLGENLQGQISEALAAINAQSDAQATALEDLRASLVPAPSLGAATETAEAETGDSPAAPAPTAAAEASGLGVGETALFNNGGLRAFVARVTDEGARVLVQGEMVEMSPGERLMVMAGRDFCEVTLDAVAGGRAEIGGACGDELPAAEGLAVGETALFYEGALRAFVSRVDGLENRARITVNGTPSLLRTGQVALVTLEDDVCGVTLDAVDRTRVTLGSGCGTELGLAGPVTTGGTAVLGDGAVRVFVSEVGDDGVRVKLSGQGDMTALQPGDALALSSGCEVVLAVLNDEGAHFRHHCAG